MFHRESKGISEVSQENEWEGKTQREAGWVAGAKGGGEVSKGDADVERGRAGWRESDRKRWGGVTEIGGGGRRGRKGGRR